MLTIAVCEDEIDARVEIVGLLERYLKARSTAFSIRTFSSGEELLAYGSTFDLAVMDIEMKRVDGLSAARTLCERSQGCAVIFVTMHPDYVFDSFDVNVVGYLLKPVEERRFFAALDKALKRHEQNEEPDAIVVKTGGIYHKLRLSQILFCESVGHKVRIQAGHASVEYYGTIEALQDELTTAGREGGDFFRCHRAFIVNLRHVSGRRGEYIDVAGNYVVPLARRRQQDFSSSLLSFFKRSAF